MQEQVKIAQMFDTTIPMKLSKVHSYKCTVTLQYGF